MRFLLQSRCHKLQSFEKAQCFIKRDDELSFGISGCKLRKYSSLIDHINSHCFESVAAIGSSYSNNIVGLLQLLHENGIRPTLYLLKPRFVHATSNMGLIALFKPKVVFVDRIDWKNVEMLANTHHDFVIAEGGFMSACLPGAKTLGSDILRNEKELSLSFDHVFIEAGTALSAIGLILSRKIKAKIHVVLLAQTFEEFDLSLKSFNEDLRDLNYELHIPNKYKSFGSTGKEIFSFIQTFAMNEGVLLDPIYSAKLFINAEQIIQKNSLKGNILIIHSGGALSLSGFMDKFHLPLLEQAFSSSNRDHNHTLSVPPV